MATAKQKAAARRNLKKARAALKRKHHRKGTHGIAGLKGLAGRHRRPGRPRKKRRGTSGVAGLASDKLIQRGRFRIKGRSYKIMQSVRPKRRRHKGGRHKKTS